LKPNAEVHAALAAVESVLKRHAPDAPFNYALVDDDYAKLFNHEERIGKLATGFAGLAVFISCIGILGLAAFASGQRAKEIGIRKVLGASIFQVWQMLSLDFARLVVAAMVVAFPLVWYIGDQWLLQYDYRIEMSPWVFVLTGIATLAVTLATISFESVKAALVNPVNSLRSE